MDSSDDFLSMILVFAVISLMSFGTRSRVAS